MTKKKVNDDIVVALDIGTSKVAAIIAEIDEDNQIEIIGAGAHSSTGLKRGVVVNIETTVDAISHAVEEAELMSGRSVSSVQTVIDGNHIKSFNSHGIFAIQNKEVNEYDIDKVIDAARAVAIPTDQKIIHILPQEFIIDHQGGIHDPIGMSGVRLETNVHIVTGNVSATQNVVKCIEKCGLTVDNVILQQLAASCAVLTEDEKELGVAIIDIGAGTTDIAIFFDGAIQYTSVIPVAGDQVTNDIAIALKTPTKSAEDIKIQYGLALKSLADETIKVEVPNVAQRNPKELSQAELADVIEARYEEILHLVLNDLKKNGFYERISAAGIVFTGGAAKISGMLELAEKIFQIPVRIGVPKNIKGLSDILSDPSYATGIGLLLFSSQNSENKESSDKMADKVSSFWGKIKSWFGGNF